eukprot:scaffold13822_cov84-Isochrysis_galbana.AAC.1
MGTSAAYGYSVVAIILALSSDGAISSNHACFETASMLIRRAPPEFHPSTRNRALSISEQLRSSAARNRALAGPPAVPK